MGNLIPLDAAKKQECEDIAKEFLGTFSAQYVLAYGVEFTKMKMKEIDDEAFGEPQGKKELMYRQNFKCTEPHKIGPLKKKGAIVKNWKNRYFVVNPDYSVSYYVTEEMYQKGGKPKGVIHLAGYEAAESADNQKIAKVKALAKKLGVDEESLPLPEKFPPHTLSLSHERRRVFYITAADEDEKKEWVEMFRTCCRKAKGFKNEDPVAQAAFKTAYRRACRESNWYGRINATGGTEEQVLTETIVELINNRVLSSVYSDLTGNFMIRKKIQGQVIKMLDTMVIALVTPAYKTLVETTEKMKAPAEKTFNEKKDEIVEVQKNITEKMAEKMVTIVTRAVDEVLTDIKKLYEDLKELAVKITAEMRKECVVRLLERLVKDTKEGKDVEAAMKKNYRIFDRMIFGTTTWDHWYKVYNIEQQAIHIISKYEETFGIRGSYTYVYASHDIVAKVADAAFYTFEQTLEEQTKDTDILKDNNKASEKMAKVKDEVLVKYDHDSKPTPEDVAFQLLTTHIVEYVTKKIDPLTKDVRKELQSAIPEPLQQLISIQDRYELYVEECCKELIRAAVGMPTPQVLKATETDESVKTKTSKTSNTKMKKKTANAKMTKKTPKKNADKGEEGEEEDAEETNENGVEEDETEKNGEEKDEQQESSKESGSEEVQNGETMVENSEEQIESKEIQEDESEEKQNGEAMEENSEENQIESTEVQEDGSEENVDEEEPENEEEPEDEPDDEETMENSEDTEM